MKKQAKIYQQKLTIGPENLTKLQALKCQSSDDKSTVGLILDCLHEQDSLKQASLLKKISAVIQGCQDCPSLTICLEVLAQMFVVIDYKNPARRSLASLFDNLPDSSHDVALDCLCTSVVSKLKEVELNHDSTEAYHLRSTIDMVSSLMENFKLGNNVVRLSGLKILTKLSTFLKHLVQSARSTTNPAEQSTLMNSCLAATKTIIAVVQKTCRQMKDDIQCFEQFEAIGNELVVMLNSDFLPDCQTASGMALCLIICSDQNHCIQLILETFFSHFNLQSVHGVEQMTNNVKQDWISRVMSLQKWQAPLSFSHLCVCHGVLTMVPLDELIKPLGSDQSGTSQTLLFDVLLNDLCLLCESLKEPYSSLTAFKVLSLWTEQAKNSIRLHNSMPSLKTQVIGSAPIPQKLLSLVWDHWDHPIEIIRYQTKAIFEHIVGMHVEASGLDPRNDSFLKDLTGKLIQVGWHCRGIYGPLCCLTSVIGASTLLDWYPCIPSEVMNILRDCITAPHVIDFIDTLSTNHKQEILANQEDMDSWLKTWVVPIISLLCHLGSVQQGFLIEQTLSKLLRCYPGSLKYIVDNLRDHYSMNIEILITCLRTARTLGIIKVNDNCTDSKTETWGGVVPVLWLEKAMHHIEEQTRIDALGLLCDSPRTTEPFSVTDLALLKVFFPLNLNNQSPSFRQQCAAHLKKLLMRMKESLRISSKQLSRGKDPKLHSKRLEVHKEFLHWFANLLFASLFPGSSLARRTTALSFLKLLSTIFVNEQRDPKREPFVFDDVMTTSNVMVLVDCLCDTSDINKVLAYELLLTCPDVYLPFKTSEALELWLQRIDGLLSSPRAVDATTACVTLKLLIEKCPLGVYAQCSDSDKRTCFVESQPYSVLRHLLEVLKTQRQVAELSLVQAASQAPMHGTVYCVREMLGHLSLRKYSIESSWKQLISVLVTECRKVASLVSPVVASSSPEGHMIDEYYEGDDGDQKVFNPVSQVLLVCCWRTMKEVALLLGDLVQSAPIALSDGTTGLLTTEQVRNIGEFFTTVLLTSKHHGAFELAYNGFVKLCRTLWSCDDDGLRGLPIQWLDLLLSDIAGCVPSDVLCGTRRSAGVPFLVQAIVTTEPKASGKSIFKRVMRELVAIASQPIKAGVSKDSTLPQVHARNILRALYRDTQLGEDVFPFVATGINIAISGFLSDSWAVRNSSTLLFSALMTRVFGVKKSKDEHSRRNCMTGREFFTRFPELHSFFVERLRESTEAIERSSGRSLHPSLYPVLLVLSRLYPSTLDGADSTLNMAAFTPYVMRCGKSSVLKTRCMAGRAIVPLVAGETMVDTLEQLFKSLPTSMLEIRQNEIHGTLLQIQHIVKDHLVNSLAADLIKSMVATKVIPMLEPILWIGTRNNPCDVTRAVILDILYDLIVCPCLELKEESISNSSFQTDDCYVKLRKSVIQLAFDEAILNRPSPCIAIGKSLVQEVCARILLHENTTVSSPLSDCSKVPMKSHPLPMDHCSVVCSLLASRDYEVRLVVLQYLNTTLSHFKPCSSSAHVDSVNAVGAQNNGRFGGDDLKKLASVVLEMATGEEQHLDCLGQGFLVLSLIINSLSFPHFFPSGKQISLIDCLCYFSTQSCELFAQRDDIKCALLELMASLVKRVYESHSDTFSNEVSTRTFHSINVFISLLKSSSQDDKSFEVRLKVADILSGGALNTLLWDPHMLLGCLPLELWEVVVTLLNDDDVHIRECTARVKLSSENVNPQKDSCFSTPALVMKHVLRTVYTCYYPKEPRATLQWMLGWIVTHNAFDGVTDSSASSNDQQSEIDLLFEKNTLNSYHERVITSKSAMQCLRDVQMCINNTGNDVRYDVTSYYNAESAEGTKQYGLSSSKACTSISLESGNDVTNWMSKVIDDITVNCVHRLRALMNDHRLDIPRRFTDILSNCFGLLAAGFIRMQADPMLKTTESKPKVESLDLITLSISQETKSTGFTKSTGSVQELILELKTIDEFKSLLSHPVMDECVNDLCEIYRVL